MWFNGKKSTGAAHSEETVRLYSLRRLARVFGLSEDSLSLTARFGEDLTANPANDFKFNQFDIIDGDIRDVADRQIVKEIERGTLVIQILRTHGSLQSHQSRRSFSCSSSALK